MKRQRGDSKTEKKLKERIKELNCLYGLSRLMDKHNIPEDKFLQSAVNLIPPAWQYPEMTCARIILNKKEYKTKGFKETQWKQSANIVVNNKTEGRLDVFYLEEKPEMDEGPFLKEERNTLNSFVKYLEQYLNRKEKENDLRRSKKILLKTQDMANIGNWELDLATNHLSWSDEVYRIFGLKPQEFSATYQAFLEYVHPDDRAKVDRAYASSLEEGRDTYEIEHRVVRKHNGEIRHVYEKCYHERNQKEKVFRSVGMIQDVTKQKEIENALRESRENLRITINSIGDAVIATDTKGHITRMNPVAAKLTGWTSTEAENQPLEKVFNIVNTKSGNKPDNPVKDVLNTGKIVGLANDTKLISKNGEEYQIADSGSPIKNDHGEITGVVLAFRDVTEDYHIREKLKDSEERFRTTLETMNEGCQIIDFDWRFIYVNQTLVEHGRKSRKELLGRTMMEVYPGIEKTELFDSLRKCMSERISQRFENQFTYPDGSTGWFDLSIQPSAEGIYIFSIDITSRKEAEEKIRENERQLATLMGNLPGMAYRCRNDKNWTMEFVSSGCLSLTGYNDKQLTYNVEGSYAGLIDPGDRDMVRKETQKAIQNNQPFLIEYRIHDKENNLKWMWEQGSKVDKNLDGTDILEGFIMDITDRKEAEDHLRQSEEKFRIIVERAPDPIFIQTDMKFAFLNPAACRLFGIESPEELIGMPVMERFHADNYEEIKNRIKRLNEDRESVTGLFEQKFIRVDGTEVWVETAGEPITYQEKKGALVFVRDITERKQAEETIHKSEQKFRNIFNHTGDAIIIQNMQGDFIEVNDIACKRSGYSREEFMKKYPEDIVLPDYAQKIEEHRNIIKHNGEMTFETVISQKDGFKVPLEVNARLIEFEGEPAIISVIRDISERKKTEKVKQLLYNVSQLSISDMNLKQYLGTIHKEVREIMKADNFYIALYDKNTDKYTLPYHVDEYDDLTTDEPMSLKHTLTDYICKTGEAKLVTEDFERKLRRKEKIQVVGTPSPVWIGAPVKDTSTDAVTGVIALQDYENKNAYDKDDVHTLSIIATNIGIFIERINNLENLKKAKEKAEESDRLKTAFLATLSHEIRTPMNGILGFTNLLMDSDLTNEEKDQYTEIIQKSGHRMMNTVNDIIEISKIEAGIISVQKTTTNANKIVKELVSFFRSEAQKKGLTLELDQLLPENASALHTDQNKLESVLTNLIKNAIKYTDSGSISVGCQVKDRFVKFYVKDTGIGVPEDRQKAIFNRFEQADISDTRAFEGSGLGLAICKSYVEMLEGEIWLESEENKGSVFYFSLPMSKAKKGESHKGSEEQSKTEHALKTEVPANKPKILIAEDDEDSFIYLKTVLRKLDGEIIHTITGAETVKKCLSNPDIDLILMDIKLPGMDGYEATRNIREFNQKVPIIAQTAYALEGDRQKALDAGCNDYLAKPVKKSELLSKMKHLMER